LGQSRFRFARQDASPAIAVLARAVNIKELEVGNRQDSHRRRTGQRRRHGRAAGSLAPIKPTDPNSYKPQEAVPAIGSNSTAVGNGTQQNKTANDALHNQRR
jgi:hypothetical protein